MKNYRDNQRRWSKNAETTTHSGFEGGNLKYAEIGSRKIGCDSKYETKDEQSESELRRKIQPLQSALNVGCQ